MKCTLVFLIIATFCAVSLAKSISVSESSESESNVIKTFRGNRSALWSYFHEIRDNDRGRRSIKPKQPAVEEAFIEPEESRVASPILDAP